MLIGSFGFDVPETLITTDAAAVEAFLAQQGSIIYKSISGVRSIVARFSEADLSRLGDVAWCPTQFQEFVEGRDYRVHVIGDDVFACEVISDADDYRYASRSGMSVEIRRAVLPADIVSRCRALGAGLRLPVAGIDLRRTPGERWYCFEVNPSPGFSYYEHATGQPIALSVARLLLQASPRR
jgi:glutathione synthase/RimK-type ligase-like ATP-grasp enzyme